MICVIIPYAETEDVGLAGVLFVVQDLGGHVAGRAAAGEQQPEVLLERREAQVDQHRKAQVRLPRVHDVLRLHVPVDYVLVFQVGQGLWSVGGYFEHPARHDIYGFSVYLSLFVVDDRTKTFTRVKFTEAVDVVITLVDF
jgi:hypothetical protein